jgi:proteasome accessory factor A
MDNRRECLFGSETELALRVETKGANRPVPADLAAAVIDDVANRHVHLPSAQSPSHRRLFLGNGGCVYTDQGWHPECATAESTNVIDLAAQTIALRTMMAESAATVGRVYGIPLKLVANNIDYGFGTQQTYGHHLNVLLRGVTLPHAVRQLTPLLAAMPLIAGSGKVSFGNLVSGFELSQRAAFVSYPFGKRTQSSRAMVTQKDEPLGNNGSRFHLISMDTAMSRWQLVLVPAIIGLTLKVIELGEDVANDVALADPVRALQTVSCDLSLKVKLPLAAGGSTTALDILDHYRGAVEQYLGRSALPDWASPLVSLWAEVTSNLRTDPFSEHGRLDWVRKLLLFTEELRREELSWADYCKWIYVIGSVRRLKVTFPDLDPLRLTSSEVARAGIRRSALGILERHLADQGLSWKDFPRMWRVANRLCTVCLNYHTLGEEKFTEDCPWITQEMIRHATTHPPKGTRAEVRAEAIGKAAVGATASWTHVSSGGRRLTVLDPFGGQATWKEEQATSLKEN